jgi:hypothetical protein
MSKIKKDTKVNKCDHKKEVSEKVISEEWDYWANDFVQEERRETYEVSAFEDLDLHRLKCSICGEIDYYSQAARNYYEKGVDNGALFVRNKK